MKLLLLLIGKTDSKSLLSEMDKYEKKIPFYLPFSMVVIPDIKRKKSISHLAQKNKEGELILNHVTNNDYIVLLDEGGKEFNSLQFAQHIEKKKNSISKRLVFIIGGPYGFSEQVKKRANEEISLSKMTFTHQMVRLIFMEQLYRALTILNNEPYHHI